ncbi:MAG: class I SAM-dependent methyltransferase, partial [Alphaproteobacteria bacterium]
RYDLMNDLMSAGMHRLWKNDMVRWLAPRAGQQILDVAGGTGDIAQRIRKAAGCHVTVLDINEQMITEGRDRAIDTVSTEGFSWLCGDAEALPLPDSSFDAYTIAFGIRNVTHIDNALAEAFRVLRPGGRFLCLEFSHLPNEFLQTWYDRYSFSIIPTIGEKVTGDKAAYQYLVESIRQFPDQEAFAGMIRTAGFDNVQYRNLSHGVVALHSGRKF